MATKYVTIYTLGGFGTACGRKVAKLIETGLKPHGSNPAAPYVHYVEKGKRKPEGYVFSSEWLVIVNGDGPEPPEYGVEREGGMVRTRIIIGGDDGQRAAANAFANSIDPATVLHDYRKDADKGAPATAAVLAVAR